jgi:hypothetical protein
MKLSQINFRNNIALDLNGLDYLNDRMWHLFSTPSPFQRWYPLPDELCGSSDKVSVLPGRQTSCQTLFILIHGRGLL